MSDDVRQSYVALLRGMLSPSWQKPSDRKIAALLQAADGSSRAPSATGDQVQLDQAHLVRAVPSENRRRLTALVAARTKLDAASRLAKEATVDIASSGLLPVEVREELRAIAADVDAFVQSRINTTIEHIP